MTVYTYQQKKEKLEQKLGSEYKVKKIFTNEKGVEVATIHHKVCKAEKNLNYKYVRSSKKEQFCEVCAAKQFKQRKQDLLDEKFGKGQITLVEYNGERKKSLFKANQCGHTFSVLYPTIIDRKDTNYICPECQKNTVYKPVLSDEEIQRKLDEVYNRKIIYVNDKQRTGNIAKDPLTFKFRKCNHTFERLFYPLIKSKNTEAVKCQICENDIVKNHYRKLNDVILPSHEIVGRATDTKKVIYDIRCKECNEITAKIRVESGMGKYAKCKCSCGDINQQEIINNFLDIFHIGKTDKLNKYISIDDLRDFQIKRTTNYKFQKSFEQTFMNSMGTFYENNQFITDIPFPQDKISMDFTNLNMKFKFEGVTYKLLNVYAFDLKGLYDINKVIEIEYETSTVQRFLFVIKKGRYATYTSLRDSTGERKVANLVFNILHLLTNYYNERTTKFTSKIRKNSYRENNIDEVGITEHKVLTKDIKTKYVNIVNVGNTKRRKIKASYDVAGHFRHYIKTGKRIYIASFEKGKQYRHIRRIEKDYIIK